MVEEVKKEKVKKEEVKKEEVKKKAKTTKTYKGPYWNMDDMGKYWLTFATRCDDDDSNYIYCLPQFRSFVETVISSDLKCGVHTVGKPTKRMLENDSITASMMRFKRHYNKTVGKKLDLDIPDQIDWPAMAKLGKAFEA